MRILVERDEGHHGSIDEPLARVLEIHGDAVADRRLHLSHAPIGLAGMTHAGAWDEPVAQRYLPRMLSGSDARLIIVRDIRRAQVPERNP